jgi:hypothetical protein
MTNDSLIVRVKEDKGEKTPRSLNFRQTQTKIMVYIFLRDYFEIFTRYILNLYYICLILFRVNFWQNVTFDMLKMYREEKPLVPLSLNLKSISAFFRRAEESAFFRRAEEWQACREQGGKRGERKSVIVAHSPTILCIPVGALT